MYEYLYPPRRVLKRASRKISKFYTRHYTNLQRTRPWKLIAVFIPVIILTFFFSFPLGRHDYSQYEDMEAESFVTNLCGDDCASVHHNHRVNVKRVQYVERKFNGFGAQFLRIMDASAVAQLFGADFEITTQRYWNYGCAPWNGWSCYFVHSNGNIIKPDASCVELENFEDWDSTNSGSPNDCIRISTTRSGSRSAAVLRRLSEGAAFKISHMFATRLWKLNTRTRRNVENLLHQTHLKPYSYIGVHVRRGDKILETQPAPIEKYAKAIDCIDPTGQKDIYIASDDSHAVQDLTKRILMKKNRHVVSLACDKKLGGNGHYQAQANRHYLKRNRPRVEALLADIEALRQAEAVIATFSSNLARAVHVLRRNNRTVSLDDRWASGSAWRTFHQSYCSKDNDGDRDGEFCKCMSL